MPQHLVILLCCVKLSSINVTGHFGKNVIKKCLWWSLGPNMEDPKGFCQQLCLVPLPSLGLLYLLDEMNPPSWSVKTIVNKCYWCYEYSDLNKSRIELLDVENWTISHINAEIGVQISAATDVIHFWQAAALGLKVYAACGCWNQSSLLVTHPWPVIWSILWNVGCPVVP